MQHHFHPTILRSYDIRGIVGETLHEADAHAIGFGLGAIVRSSGGSRVAVCRDGRLSSPALAAALKDGLIAAGMSVCDIGAGPTPLLYFADRHLACDAAIQVTGSHNPPTHNGFKMVLGHAPFFGEEIQHLGSMMAAGVDGATGGSAENIDLNAAYLDAISAAAGEITGLDGQTVIWDCGNGATGPLTEALTATLAGRHKVLFAEVDGTFPNHHPDPVDPETLDLLRAAVAGDHALMGIAFDGDGDRIGIIDSTGRQVPGDLLTAYLARGAIARNAGAAVIFDVKSSLAALDAVSRAGGIPSLWKTGHSHMKTRLKQTGAPLAGEMSGHIFIAEDYFGFDDALYAALAILRETARSGETLTGFLDNLPPVYATPELRIPCPDEIKFDLVRQVIADVAGTPDGDQQDITDIDGVRVTGDLGWWLIRASNTGAELVARAEGRDEAGRDELRNRIRMRLAAAGLDWQG